MKTTILYYIHDPMCSWCYAFKPALKQLRQQLPKEIEWITLLGGLADDTNAPMPEKLRQQLCATWLSIEKKVPEIKFNYAFWDDWQHTQPRRATYPACRAVIAAHSFDRHNSDGTQVHTYENLIIDAIQTAYYQQALNPSDNSVLIKLAGEIGLNKSLFQTELSATHTQNELDNQIGQSRQMNVSSYPSLVLKIDQGFWPVSIDYQTPDSMLEVVNLLLEFE
jgi:putative protein-disulfide isomerase